MCCFSSWTKPGSTHCISWAQCWGWVSLENLLNAWRNFWNRPPETTAAKEAGQIQHAAIAVNNEWFQASQKFSLKSSISKIPKGIDLVYSINNAFQERRFGSIFKTALFADAILWGFIHNAYIQNQVGITSISHLYYWHRYDKSCPILTRVKRTALL